MKFSIVALAAICGLATAEKAVVTNQCSTPIYVQSYPYGGGKPGPLTTVQPGKSFSEDFRRTGSVSNPDLSLSTGDTNHVIPQTVKIAKTKTLTSPLFFGYSFSSNPDYAYCKLLLPFRGTLDPGLNNS